MKYLKRVLLLLFALIVIGGPLYLQFSHPQLSDLELLLRYGWFYLLVLALCSAVIVTVSVSWLLDLSSREAQDPASRRGGR